MNVGIVKSHPGICFSFQGILIYRVFQIPLKGQEFRQLAKSNGSSLLPVNYSTGHYKLVRASTVKQDKPCP